MAAIRWARAVRGISSTQKLVLLLLADHADDKGVAWPSVPGLVADSGLSERSVQYAMRDLAQVGLLTIAQGGGRFRTSTYQLALAASETPQQVRGIDAQASEETPHQLHPIPTETVQLTTETPQLTTETPQLTTETPHQLHPNPHRTLIEPSVTPKGGVGGGVSVALPEWLPPAAWADWCGYRKGKTWTQRAAELSIAKLGELRAAGDDPVAVIHQSIANGWRGLFPAKSRGRQQQPASKLDWIFDDPIFGDDANARQPGGVGALPAPVARSRVEPAERGGFPQADRGDHRSHARRGAGHAD